MIPLRCTSDLRLQINLWTFLKIVDNFPAPVHEPCSGSNTVIESLDSWRRCLNSCPPLLDNSNFFFRFTYRFLTYLTEFHFYAYGHLWPSGKGGGPCCDNKLHNSRTPEWWIRGQTHSRCMKNKKVYNSHVHWNSYIIVNGLNPGVI